MSLTPPRINAVELMQPPYQIQSENVDGLKVREKERSRSTSKDYSREREKEKKKDREREKEKKKKRNRSREREHDSRSRSRSRERRKSDRRDRESRYSPQSSRGRNRTSNRSEKYERDRSRSRSHERRKKERSRRDRSRDRRRSGSSDRDRRSRTDTAREPRENRFDLTQTIQELMNSTTSTKNFASLFNCTNSNDSCSNGPSENSQDGVERKRRKKSRWGGTENDKTFIPGMPTILPSTLDPTQQEAYLVQLQIEEISRKLRTGELGIPQNPEERSPSPEPIYSSDGKRLNTREFRFRKRLEEQRHQLIQKMQSVNPEFKPPADYKPPVTRVSDKVLIPQEQHPDINFVGLLIGPRGNTLKAMEKETGAKIIIRGKGSVKEGKVGRKDGQPLPGEDEPLHAFITAPNPEAVKKAVDKIKDVIRQGIEVPEGHNDLRRMQLRELAQLNGTLRETDCPRCTNCGSAEHKTWLCPDKPNVTNSIVCTACGGAGHISKDCRSKRPGAAGAANEDSQAKIDEEYMSLMAELGEGPPPQSQPKTPVDPLAQVHLNRGYSLFEKKPAQMQAIQAPTTTQPSSTPNPVHVTGPPPPITPITAAWGVPPNLPPGTGMPAMAIPPMIPPPPNGQPPLPAPPPLMPPIPPMAWMGAAQPPPPGGESVPPLPPNGAPPPPPPGTGRMQPPLIPPPPGVGPPIPWSAPNFGANQWNNSNVGYIPPPPPCAPMGGLAQPPPPPPPSN